jgi:hypothetical protein
MAPSDLDEGSGLPADEPAGGPISGTATDARGRRLPVLGVVAAVGLLSVAVLGAYLLGQRSSSDAAPTTTTLGALDPAVTGIDPSGDLVAFEDPDRGLSLSYPRDWRALELDGADPSTVLVLSAGGQDSVLVRAVELAEPVTAENLADMNAVTDGIIAGSEVTVLQESEIELNGMPGFYYLYLFDDAATGEEGVHAHYFLFQGGLMHIIVFQAVPTARFDLLAPAFDAVAASFQVEPPPAEVEPASSSEATTTSAG